MHALWWCGCEWGLAVNLGLIRLYCSAYRQKGIPLSNIPELRWHLSCKYMAESKKLPPTLGALKQHILRARVQARVWGQAAVPQQKLLDPLKNGYHRDSDDGQLKPTTTDVPPAPEAIVKMVRFLVQGKLLIKSLFMQVQELAIHWLMSLQHTVRKWCWHLLQSRIGLWQWWLMFSALYWTLLSDIFEHKEHLWTRRLLM